jgi:outer membrane lipopolysaccharide assembly protein LptE/RlpB
MRALLAIAAVLLSSCGYHLAGTADTVPKTIQTIAIPEFNNPTTRYKLTDRLPAAITRELISRTRYKVISDQNQADAVLTGAVNSIFVFPSIFDPQTGRASAIQIAVNVQVTLRERATGKVLFTRPAFTINERYETSTNAETYFEESDAALDRVSRQVARAVVSAILEGF